MRKIRSKSIKNLLEVVNETVAEFRKKVHPQWRTLWEYTIGLRPLLPQGLARSKTAAHIYDSQLIWQTILIKNGAITLNIPDFWVQFKRYYDNYAELSTLIRSLLRFYWLKCGAQEEVRIADRYARIVGQCPVRVGYEILFNPHLSSELSSEDISDALFTDTEVISEGVWEERPVIRHVSPFRFFYDQDISLPNLEYARWCCEVFYLTEEQLSMLPYRGLKELKPTAQRDDIGQGEKASREYYELWSIWDKDLGLHILYSPSVPEKAIAVEKIESPFPGFFPYELWTIYDLPDLPRAMGDAQLLLVPAQTFNYLRTVELNFVDRTLPRFFYRKGALTEQGKRALEAGNLLQGIEIETDEQLNNVVMPFVPATLPQTLLLLENTLREDITTLSGVTDFHRGIPLPTKRLATEVALVAQLSGIRGQIEQQKFESFLSRVVNKLYHAIRNFTAEPIVIPVTINGKQELRMITPTTLPDDVEIYIAASGGAVDRALERRDIIELFKFLAQAGLPLFTWIPFIQRLLATYNIHPEEARLVVGALHQAALQQILAQQMEALKNIQTGEQQQGEEVMAEEMPELEEPELSLLPEE